MYYIKKKITTNKQTKKNTAAALKLHTTMMKVKVLEIRQEKKKPCMNVICYTEERIRTENCVKLLFEVNDSLFSLGGINTVTIVHSSTLWSNRLVQVILRTENKTLNSPG